MFCSIRLALSVFVVLSTDCFVIEKEFPFCKDRHQIRWPTSCSSGKASVVDRSKSIECQNARNFFQIHQALPDHYLSEEGSQSVKDIIGSISDSFFDYYDKLVRSDFNLNLSRDIICLAILIGLVILVLVLLFKKSVRGFCF